MDYIIRKKSSSLNANLVCKTFDALNIMQLIEQFKAEGAKVNYVENQRIKITDKNKEMIIEQNGKEFEVTSFTEKAN